MIKLPCSKCGGDAKKPIRKHSRNGTIYRLSYCILCVREINRISYERIMANPKRKKGFYKTLKEWKNKHKDKVKSYGKKSKAKSRRKRSLHCC